MPSCHSSCCDFHAIICSTTSLFVFMHFMSCATLNSKGKPETGVNPEATALARCIKPHYTDTSWESIKILKLLLECEEAECFHTTDGMCVFNGVNICNSGFILDSVFTLQIYGKNPLVAKLTFSCISPVCDYFPAKPWSREEEWKGKKDSEKCQSFSE